MSSFNLIWPDLTLCPELDHPAHVYFRPFLTDLQRTGTDLDAKQAVGHGDAPFSPVRAQGNDWPRATLS